MSGLSGPIEERDLWVRVAARLARDAGWTAGWIAAGEGFGGWGVIVIDSPAGQLCSPLMHETTRPAWLEDYPGEWESGRDANVVWDRLRELGAS